MWRKITISEATESLEPWHSNDEGEEVINDSVQELVDQDSPGEMLDGLELVIDV